MTRVACRTERACALLLRNPGWLLGCCYSVARVFSVVVRLLLGYFGRLLRGCSAVARVFLVVARVLLCGC